MITVRQIDGYRACDLKSCARQARWEFTVTDGHGSFRRVYVCHEHQVEGFLRVRELQ